MERFIEMYATNHDCDQYVYTCNQCVYNCTYIYTLVAASASWFGSMASSHYDYFCQKWWHRLRNGTAAKIYRTFHYHCHQSCIIGIFGVATWLQGTQGRSRYFLLQQMADVTSMPLLRSLKTRPYANLWSLCWEILFFGSTAALSKGPSGEATVNMLSFSSKCWNDLYQCKTTILENKTTRKAKSILIQVLV